MRERVLAKRYAKALLDLGLEEKSLERIQEEVGRFARAIMLEKNLLAILSAREIETKKREQILSDLMGRLYLSPYVQNFFKIIFKKNRILIVKDVIKAFEELVRESEGVLIAKIKVANEEAVESMKDYLRETLEAMTSKKVDCLYEEDKSLIGGLQIVIGDKIYDASIQGELERIQESI